MVITTTRQEIKDVLMEPKEMGVKEPYFTIPEEDQSIVVVSPGKNGVEFNKTYGLFHQFQGVLLLQCLYGQGVLLMQRNDERGEAKEFKVVTLNAGRQISVPAFWAISFVNIGKTFLVILANIDIGSKDIETKPIIDKHGLAYYVVEKKGEVSFEQNPNYDVHPQIATE